MNERWGLISNRYPENGPLSLSTFLVPLALPSEILTTEAPVGCLHAQGVLGDQPAGRQNPNQLPSTNSGHSWRHGPMSFLDAHLGPLPLTHSLGTEATSCSPSIRAQQAAVSMQIQVTVTGCTDLRGGCHNSTPPSWKRLKWTMDHNPTVW